MQINDNLQSNQNDKADNNDPLASINYNKNTPNTNVQTAKTLLLNDLPKIKLERVPFKNATYEISLPDTYEGLINALEDYYGVNEELYIDCLGIIWSCLCERRQQLIIGITDKLLNDSLSKIAESSWVTSFCLIEKLTEFLSRNHESIESVHKELSNAESDSDFDDILIRNKMVIYYYSTVISCISVWVENSKLLKNLDPPCNPINVRQHKSKRNPNFILPNSPSVSSRGVGRPKQVQVVTIAELVDAMVDLPSLADINYRPINTIHRNLEHILHSAINNWKAIYFRILDRLSQCDSGKIQERPQSVYNLYLQIDNIICGAFSAANELVAVSIVKKAYLETLSNFISEYITLKITIFEPLDVGIKHFEFRFHKLLLAFLIDNSLPLLQNNLPYILSLLLSINSTFCYYVCSNVGYTVDPCFYITFSHLEEFNLQSSVDLVTISISIEVLFNITNQLPLALINILDEDDKFINVCDSIVFTCYTLSVIVHMANVHKMPNDVTKSLNNNQTVNDIAAFITNTGEVCRDLIYVISSILNELLFYHPRFKNYISTRADIINCCADLSRINLILSTLSNYNTQNKTHKDYDCNYIKLAPESLY